MSYSQESAPFNRFLLHVDRDCYLDWYHLRVFCLVSVTICGYQTRYQVLELFYNKYSEKKLNELYLQILESLR